MSTEVSRRELHRTSSSSSLLQQPSRSLTPTKRRRDSTHRQTKKVSCSCGQGSGAGRLVLSSCLLFPLLSLGLLYVELRVTRPPASTLYIRRGTERIPPAWSCVQGFIEETSIQEAFTKEGASFLFYRARKARISTRSFADWAKSFLYSLGGNVELGNAIGLLWRLKAKEGRLKSRLDGVKFRHASGKAWDVELAFNPGRADKPINVPTVAAVDAPFDSSAFNLLMAPATELLFFYLSPVDGVGSGSAEDVALTPGMGCRPAPLREHNASLHAVLLNPYPIGNSSGLFAPFIFESYPQVLREDAILVALAFASDLTSPSFRVGYNSLGAHASVNHLHFQFWRFDASPDGLLPLERAPLTPLPSSSGRVFEVQNYPIRALAFAVDAEEHRATAQTVQRCVDYLLFRGLPHSLLLNGVYLYLIPRRAGHKLPPFSALPGFPEVSGEVIMMKEEEWSSVTGDDVFNVWSSEISLDAKTFEVLKEECVMAWSSAAAPAA